MSTRQYNTHRNLYYFYEYILWKEGTMNNCCFKNMIYIAYLHYTCDIFFYKMKSAFLSVADLDLYIFF